MRKIGLICLALIMALGTLGVGYALWSDTVTIDGTVNTGSVDIDIDGTSDTYVYKVITDWEYPDDTIHLPKGAIYFTGSEEASLDPDGDGTDELLLVASAVTTANTAEDVETVTMTFTNIFPTDTLIVADVLLHYLGTIPAHVAMGPVVWTIDAAHPDNLSAYLKMEWRYLANVTGSDWEIITNPELLQLHESDQLWLDVWFDPVLLQSNGIDAQGLSGQFSFTLMAHQWNETP